MSKSLEFCREVASDPSQSPYWQRDWSKAIEEKSEEYFDAYLNGERSMGVNSLDSSDNMLRFGIELTIDPDGEFAYFTSENCVIYRQLSQEELREIILSDIDECVNRVLSISTYDTHSGRPRDGNIVHYTVGNFVLLCEFNASANRYEITVLLPLKTRILREGIL